ncbi:peptide deformylase [Cohnella zeiphila]|uniref:Peptide deformylase n=1 Tax=Cohnella zeiphila TaxID=2761120 RepID=A0A7X0W0U7_9BACL|nr:peptide deformylase [Cohnella zeiphila]MBB6735443.1 peptide deformylase [Cohnella zeiphila]
MAVKTIVPFGDPVLRKKAKPVEIFGPRTIKLLGDLADTLYAEAGRAGLAATQLGIMRRAVVMDCGSGLIELINPEILESSGEQTGPEGCLSYPGFTGIVKRAEHVKVRTMNREGEWIEMEADGYLARCMQHEIDHLDGVLFVDRMEEGFLYHDQTQRKISLLDVLRLTHSGS